MGSTADQQEAVTRPQRAGHDAFLYLELGALAMGGPGICAWGSGRVKPPALECSQPCCRSRNGSMPGACDRSSERERTGSSLQGIFCGSEDSHQNMITVTRYVARRSRAPEALTYEESLLRIASAVCLLVASLLPPAKYSHFLSFIHDQPIRTFHRSYERHQVSPSCPCSPIPNPGIRMHLHVP